MSTVIQGKILLDTNINITEKELKNYICMMYELYISCLFYSTELSFKKSLAQ